jgi:hypothetical protein
MVYGDAIETLRSGRRVPFDAAAEIQAFRGLYSWWTMAESASPINPTIPPIRAGECVRVGASGVRDGGTPEAARLRTNLRMLPAHLACDAAGSRWFGVFPTVALAEAWCRQALVVAFWCCPDDWTPAQIRAAEAAATAQLAPYWTRHLLQAKSPRCRTCGAVVNYRRVAQKRIVPSACLQCGR